MVEPGNTALVHLLEQDLHPGEAESIALTVEMRPDILLLDETEARRIAGLYDLPVTGIIGLLMQAKAEGRVASMREERADSVRRTATRHDAYDTFCTLRHICTDVNYPALKDGASCFILPLLRQVHRLYGAYPSP
ncbi:MAG: Uncharacterized protein XE10_1447, partial [Methanoculleus marisnigri]